MRSSELVSKWAEYITSVPTRPDQSGVRASQTPQAEEELTLFGGTPVKIDPVAAKPVAVAVNLEGLGDPEATEDRLERAVAVLEELKPCLAKLTGMAYLDYLAPAWSQYEKTGDPGAFIAIVGRMVAFNRLVMRVERMLPTLKCNGHPRLAELERGLLDGALADAKVRHGWEATAELCWREFIQRAGPFGKEIQAEIP
jgi:hypothetical protein